MSNRLQHEQSPYLLQHKDNPVDWYAWGETAFRKAADEDKPIFLSIGYATCHWCHVMEHESFEDEEVARLMNETFVSVKVDREERPDIDGVYMSVCQMMTGQGGWPLTIIMTPDGRPFFAATYIPRQTRFGRIGMLDLVPRIAQLWREERERIMASADHVTRSLRDVSAIEAAGEVDTALLDAACEELLDRYDPEHGGFGSAPKFPSPHTLLFLLRYARRTGTEEPIAVVAHTLERMRLGGIFDHVGYGFHRYATDRAWLLPHFEKMLYDQAMLVLAYTEAFQVTGDPAFERTAREVLTYVLRDMTSPEGAFYSAEDADSEGREGKFYVWTADELREVLGEADARFVAEVYNVEEEGNFAEEATRHKTGENILHLKRPLDELARLHGVAAPEFEARIESVRARLFERRRTRVRPLLDDKILTDWNGLMIAALARAGRVFDEPDYVRAAGAAADFIRDRLSLPEGRLLHRYRNGDAAIPAHVDDYAFLTWGLLELYEATFRPALLRQALTLTDTLIRYFWDDAEGGFFVSASDAEQLIVRQKEYYDGALPSGNAVAAMNLLRLSRYTGDAALEERAAEVLRSAGEIVRRMPSGFTALLAAADFALGPTTEIVVTGEPGRADTREMLDVLRRTYLPNNVLLFRPSGEQEAEEIVRVAPFLAAQQPRDGKATVYVCEAFQCEAPVTDSHELQARLAERFEPNA